MSHMFMRIHTDRTDTPLDLAGHYAGPVRGACWMIGGGPSLSDLPTRAIAASTIPTFAVNLAGHGLLRPDFWTSYDPTARFHRSIYLDAGILKFINRRRAMDLVAETTFKVCECPNTVFFQESRERGFTDWLAGGDVTDWQDSLIQAIAIAYHLGFRTLYLAGTEMCVSPTPRQQEVARQRGVPYRQGELLREFVNRINAAGGPALDRAEMMPVYHFDETKALSAAMATDFHYFRVAQYLRLSRRAMALAGLELISVTPHSWLNDYFPYRPCEDVLEELAVRYGSPAQETTEGLYQTSGVRSPQGLGPMKDFRPHFWSGTEPPRDPGRSRHARVRGQLEELVEQVELDERG